MKDKDELMKQICFLLDINYTRYDDARILLEIRNKTLTNLLDGVGCFIEDLEHEKWVREYLNSIGRED